MSVCTEKPPASNCRPADFHLEPMGEAFCILNNLTPENLVEEAARRCVSQRADYDEPSPAPGIDGRTALEAGWEMWRTLNFGREGQAMELADAHELEQCIKLARTIFSQRQGRPYWDGVADIGGHHQMALDEHARASEGGESEEPEAPGDPPAKSASWAFAAVDSQRWAAKVRSRISQYQLSTQSRGALSADWQRNRLAACLAAELLGELLEGALADGAALTRELVGARANQAVETFRRADARALLGRDLRQADFDAALDLLAEHWVHGHELARVMAAEA